MKTAISLPDALFEQTNALALRLQKSRSEVVADALREHLRRNDDAAITERLDAVYAEVDAAAIEAPFLEQSAGATATRNPW